MVHWTATFTGMRGWRGVDLFKDLTMSSCPSLLLLLFFFFLSVEVENVFSTHHVAFLLLKHDTTKDPPISF